jgi:hypothetical protein
LAEVYSRGRKDASLDLRWGEVDLKAIVAKVRIIGPVEKFDALLHGRPALLGKRDSKLDHLGGLNIGELGVVALVLVDLEDVHRHIHRLATNLLGHLDDGDA